MTSADFWIERLVLVGVGLIGGSLARSLKRSGVVGEVVGTARTTATMEQAVELGVVDRVEGGIADAVAGADVVVVATPMQTMPGIMSTLNDSIGRNTIITDVGSVKGFVADAAKTHLSAHVSRFVPGHPIAGREHAGVAASTDDLFQGKTVVLTPSAVVDPDALAVVEGMWRQTGACLLKLDVATHDHLLAATSHLPHLVAYALVGYLAQQKNSELLFELAAGGFYDFTRIASSDPVMWRDICMTNRTELLRVLGGYKDGLQNLIQAIELDDGETLYRCFETAKESRDQGLHRKNIKSSNDES